MTFTPFPKWKKQNIDLLDRILSDSLTEAELNITPDCDRCAGEGYLNDNKDDLCPTCHGKGFRSPDEPNLKPDDVLFIFYLHEYAQDAKRVSKAIRDMAADQGVIVLPRLDKPRK